MNEVSVEGPSLPPVYPMQLGSGSHCRGLFQSVGELTPPTNSDSQHPSAYPLFFNINPWPDLPGSSQSVLCYQPLDKS